jgi:predicted permease
VLTAQIAPPSERYASPEKQAGFVWEVLEHLSAVPGVRDASLSNFLPTTGTWLKGFIIVGDPTPDPAHFPVSDFECVTPDYFRTMGIPLRRGRGVLTTDDRRAAGIVVVDELFTHTYFPGRDPIGQRLSFGDDTVPIVGVVGSVKQRGLMGDAAPVMYRPFAQCPARSVYLEARTAGDPVALTGSLKQAILAVDPTAPVYDIKTMTARMAESTGTTRFSTLLASVFAAVALTLSVVGLYSVLAYVVSQRRRELGVRLALGASNAHLMSEVLRQAAVLTLGGIACGSLVAWLLARALAGIFVGVRPHDPVVFTAGIVAFAAIALIATSVPAWRTTRIDPAVVLTSG